jgi:hypothetical protein
VLSTGKTKFADLESLVGRLNHAAYVIPLSRHFMNRLRIRLQKRTFAKQELTLSKAELADLELWLDFLRQAWSGISMNLLTIRRPTRIGISDSCPYGLGGFSWSGRAWRLRIPRKSPLHGDSVANNFLEFLAMMITIWTIIVDCEADGQTEECILSLGDNTSAIGWIFRTKGIGPDSVYFDAVNLVARRLARLILGSSNCLFSQHLPGITNVVSDLLSYEGSTRSSEKASEDHPLAPDHPSDEELTERFHSFLPQLIPRDFAISPLPSEIASFATLAIRTAESSWIRSRKDLTRRETGPGDDGPASVTTWELSTLSSLSYPPTSRNSSFEPSSSASAFLISQRQAAFADSVRGQWWHRLSEVPRALWQRRSGTVSNRVPFTSRTGSG